MCPAASIVGKVQGRYHFREQEITSQNLELTEVLTQGNCFFSSQEYIIMIEMKKNPKIILGLSLNCPLNMNHS